MKTKCAFQRESNVLRVVSFLIAKCFALAVVDAHTDRPHRCELAARTPPRLFCLVPLPHTDTEEVESSPPSLLEEIQASERQATFSVHPTAGTRVPNAKIRQEQPQREGVEVTDGRTASCSLASEHRMEATWLYHQMAEMPVQSTTCSCSLFLLRRISTAAVTTRSRICFKRS